MQRLHPAGIWNYKAMQHLYKMSPPPLHTQTIKYSGTAPISRFLPRQRGQLPSWITSTSEPSCSKYVLIVWLRWDGGGKFKWLELCHFPASPFGALPPSFPYFRYCHVSFCHPPRCELGKYELLILTSWECRWLESKRDAHHLLFNHHDIKKEIRHKSDFHERICHPNPRPFLKMRYV